MSHYYDEAKDDAKEFATEFLDQIVGQLLVKGEASDDYNNDYDGGDSHFHESYVDKDYGLLEAAELLDALDQYEETDSGLWEGQEPRQAIATQAAFTYGNAVGSLFSDLIKEINGEIDVREIMDDLESKETEKHKEEEYWEFDSSEYEETLEDLVTERVKQVIANF